LTIDAIICDAAGDVVDVFKHEPVSADVARENAADDRNGARRKRCDLAGSVEIRVDDIVRQSSTQLADSITSPTSARKRFI
jgi:hypothetical protein